MLTTKNLFRLTPKNVGSYSRVFTVCRPENVMEWHAVGPQPAYKTFEDILIVLFQSIVVKEWVFFYTFFAISVYV